MALISERYFGKSKVAEVGRVGPYAHGGIFSGFVISRSCFRVPVVSHSGDEMDIRLARNPTSRIGSSRKSTDSRCHSAATPKGCVCRDKSSPCYMPSPNAVRLPSIPCPRLLWLRAREAEFFSHALMRRATARSPARCACATFARFVSTAV